MKTKLLFFGRIAERLGADWVIDVPDEGCTVADLRRKLSDECPAAAELMLQGNILAAVDQEMVDDGVQVRPGQEIAFFSPLSGG